MEKKAVYTLHHENVEWLNKLDFYRDELRIIQDQLDKIAAKNTSKEIMMQVEHFQNQRIIQQRSLDEMRKSIRSEEKGLDHNLAQNSVAADHRSAPDHAQEREQMASFERVMEALRHEFRNFLSARM